MTFTSRMKILLNFLAIMFASLSAEAAELVLKSRVEVQGGIVRLGDVVDINSADRSRASRLTELTLFPTPSPTRVRTLHVRELRELLELNGIPLEGLRFSGARLARVSASRPAPRGPVRTTPIVEESHKYVVARRLLTRGDVIRSADVELRMLTDPPNRLAPATDLQQVVGREVMRTVLPDQLIDPTQLRRPLLVRRGESVQVQAKAAGVVVTTSARAMEDGAAGDVIVLQSLNREKYQAQVTGLKQAVIYVAGVQAVDSPQPGGQLSPRVSRK